MTKQKLQNKNRNFGSYFIDKLPLIMAFIIPVLILLVIYIGREVFPFGDNTYLRSDMYHQYAPFMKEFQRNIKEGGSFLYAWNIGLGNNFASTYSYYLASPANWLVGLFPENLIPEFMNMMLIIKSGLMSSFFAYFLIKKYRKNNYIATAFGCFYAMSAYMAAFSWNVMWLDCLVLFPLIILGMDALVKKGKFRLYTISLAICIISNYYISIMICIFLIFYFIYLLAVNWTLLSKSEIIHRCCLVVLTSVAAGCMAMFVILPALFNLFITASADSGFPSRMTAYYNILEMLSKSVINTEVSVFSGHFPNIYSTMALFVLVPMFWVSKRVNAREKAGKTALICLLAFSFMFNVPTYIWHGFHFPNSLPCRYSFIYIFLTLEMGYQAFIYVKRFTVKEICLCCCAGVGGVFILQALYGSDSFDVENAAAGAGFILMYFLLVLLYRNRRASKVLSMILLMIVCIGEIVINTNNTGYSTTSRVYYMSDNEAMESMLAQVDDGSFYRVERTNRRTKNDGTWLDYDSASIFSSTTVAGISDLYKTLGMQGMTNSFSYYGHTPVTQALLGVRYELAPEEQKDPLMTQAASYDSKLLYENKYALSLGYMVNDDIYQTQLPSSQPFQIQNDLIYNACGVDNIFKIYGSLMGEKVEFECDASGRLLLYITTDIDKCTVAVERDGQEAEHYDFSSLETPQILDVYDVIAGDKVTVSSRNII